ncbi:hypothetical protein [Roseovarius sp.]|nr:hypothetical protein [Roseovarius sp.]MDM8164531.1 hypothetical protein [Roseovarius sp.]
MGELTDEDVQALMNQEVPEHGTGGTYARMEMDDELDHMDV